MTGYGRASSTSRQAVVETEIRSVNGRHLQVKCRLPGDWVRLEPRIEALVRRVAHRGVVTVNVRIKVTGPSPVPSIDEKVLAVYRRAASSLGEADGALLLRLPGVIAMEEPAVSTTSVERLVMKTVREALEQMVESREAEGERLGRALTRELNVLRRHVDAVAKRAPRIVRRQHEVLRKRLEALLDGQALDRDDPLLKREVAVLADRSDVTEELDRLASHGEALSRTLEKSGPVGRELDFQLQEVGREVNTIGSKVNDVAATERVIHLKGCVERMREQAANIE